MAGAPRRGWVTGTARASRASSAMALALAETALALAETASAVPVQGQGQGAAMALAQPGKAPALKATVRALKRAVTGLALSQVALTVKARVQVQATGGAMALEQGLGKGTAEAHWMAGRQSGRCVSECRADVLRARPLEPLPLTWMCKCHWRSQSPAGMKGRSARSLKCRFSS
jgi:hypothetical protein